MSTRTSNQCYLQVPDIVGASFSGSALLWGAQLSPRGRALCSSVWEASRGCLKVPPAPCVSWCFLRLDSFRHVRVSLLLPGLELTKVTASDIRWERERMDPDVLMMLQHSLGEGEQLLQSRKENLHLLSLLSSLNSSPVVSSLGKCCALSCYLWTEIL